MMKFRRLVILCLSLVLAGTSLFASGCGKAAQTEANSVFDQGRAAQKKGDYKTAIADYNLAAKTLSPDAPLSYDRGLSYYQLKQYANADQDFTDALRLANGGDHRLSPQFVQAAYWYRGVARIQEAKWAPAKSDLILAVRYYPKSWLAWDCLGYARAQLGDYKDALGDYNRGLAIYSKDAIDRNNRGLAFYHLGRQKSAVNDFTMSIHLAPRWELAYENRGLAFFAERAYADANSDFTKAIALNPKSWSWGYRCEARENLGQINQALSDCNRALAYYPNWSQVYIDRAWAKAVLGAYKGALADANLAIKYNPRNAVAYTYRGWIRQRMMQYRAAFIDYDEALRISPHYRVATQDKAQLGAFIVAAQQAGITSYGIRTINVSQMENEQQPSQSEYQQRVSECGGYYSESDSYFDDCVQNGVDQAKDDEAADQEASDQAESDAYSAQQQIQEQINYNEQEQENAAAAEQEQEDYAQSESENTQSSESDSSSYSEPEESSGDTYQESEPAEAPEPEAPAPEDNDGG
jgi:tetratricopeptide (TPR) repeat protein